MKKAGSSKSKSKTLPTSKSTKTRRKKTDPASTLETSSVSAAGPDLAQAIAVGHTPGQETLDLLNLDERAQKLLRDFQSNLLSLISHELRTPLMGILNALSLLEAPQAATEFSSEELIAMARRNATRLNQTLASLLDLAAVESGNFRAQLREVDLARLIAGRVQVHQAMLRDAGLHVDVIQTKPGSMYLADPQKIGRALELALESLISRAEQGSRIEIRLEPLRVEFVITLAASRGATWSQSWTQALAGFQGGIVSPVSAFAGALQSEQAFLTRSEEGLGSEYMLIHEIMRLHHGKFTGTLDGAHVRIALEFPKLSRRESLKAVLSSRLTKIDPGMPVNSLALALMRAPKGVELEGFCQQVKDQLYRASDSAYPLSDEGGAPLVALLLEDCKPEDAPRLIARVEFSLGLGDGLKNGWVSAPADGLDPETLIELALRRLGENLSPTQAMPTKLF